MGTDWEAFERTRLPNVADATENNKTRQGGNTVAVANKKQQRKFVPPAMFRQRTN